MSAIGKLKSKNFFCLQSKNFPPDKRHPGHRSRYRKNRPRSGYGFLRTASQPIRIENFEKPYNKPLLLLLKYKQNFDILSEGTSTGPTTKDLRSKR
jgi:hypothetical protein